MAGSKVTLRCYDLSKGMIQGLATVLKMDVEAIWHTGILVNGTEVFWSTNIIREKPAVVEREYAMSPKKVLELGDTTRTPEEIEAFLDTHAPNFNENTYNLLNNNCNHFSDFFARFLLRNEQQHVPDDILNQHKVLKDHPQGKMVMQIIEGMGDGAIKNPFRSEGEKPSWKNPCLDYIKSAPLKQLMMAVIAEDDQARITLPVILSICQNITQNVTNVKYRTVKQSSKKFALVLDHQPSLKLVEGLGFKAVDDSYTLEPVDKTVLLNMMQICKSIKEFINPGSTGEKQTPKARSTPMAGAGAGAPPIPSLDAMNDMMGNLMGGGQGGAPDLSAMTQMIEGMGGMEGIMQNMQGLLGGQGGGQGSRSGQMPDLSGLLGAMGGGQNGQAPDLSGLLGGLGGQGGQRGGASGSGSGGPDLSGLLGGLGGSGEGLGNMVNQMMSDPNMRRRMEEMQQNPEIRRMAESMAQSGGLANLLGGQGGQGGQGGMPDLSGLMQGLGGMGAGMGGQGGGNRNAESAQLDQLRQMGYTNETNNKKALRKANNDLSLALDYLMDNNLD